MMQLDRCSKGRERPATRRVAVLAGALVALVAGVVGVGGAGPVAAAGSDVRLNQMQVIGTHNSYHVELPPETIAAMAAVVPDAILLQYTHSPLPEQFENEGVRQIELDVFADPTGDLWRPTGRAGFKVFHIEQIDMESTCEVFVDCLTAVKGWSDAHPTHMPITIQLELKDSADIPIPPDPVPLTPDLLRDLDAEIRSVFPPERLITPDDVRGGHATLEEAVLTDGWPRIDDVRGRMMFILDNNRDMYEDGDTSLAGRVAFPPSTPGQPDAAFIKENEPRGTNLARIQDEVAKGYLVRTRADDPVSTPMSGDITQREAALASGAQWVSTDYPVPGLTARFGSDYFAAIPGGTPARCNPINAPVGCVSSMIEDLPPEPAVPATPPETAPANPATPVRLNPSFTG